MSTLPPRIEIAPRGVLAARVHPPGSKSVTNRALVVAALAEGESRLTGGLVSDDTEAMLAALVALGCEVERRQGGWRVPGLAGRPKAPQEPIFARGSGTTARFLTAAATLADGPVTIDGDARMRERPIGDLVAALVELGARAESLGPGGCPPVRVAGGGLPGGAAAIDASRSSQYVSALLMAAPYAARDVELTLQGGVLVSAPYVELTLEVMRAFGAEVSRTEAGALHVRAGRGYRGRAYAVEADASAAVYPLCAAAICGGRVRVEGIAEDSVQADLGMLGVLERMGCLVRHQGTAIEVRGPAAPLRAVDVDMNDFPDAVLALAVTALFAEGTTCIRNVGNLRIKETDRLSALEKELEKLGASARAGEDSLTITPGPLRGAGIRTYDDHRMAMAFALAGLRVPGVVIQDPGCVRKTWPDYFTMLESL